MLHINVGKFAEEHKCYEGRDEELDTNILDEDKLLDLLEVTFQQAADASCTSGLVSLGLLYEDGQEKPGHHQ